MTILDWIVIALVGLFFIRGFFRGFFVELFDLLALLGGYLAVRYLGPIAAPLLANHTPLPNWLAIVISVIVLFLVAAIIIRMIGRLFKKAAKKATLGGIDRFLGALFGTCKILLILIALMLVFLFIPVNKEARAYVAKGQVSKYIMKSADWLLNYLTREVTEIKLHGADPDLVFLKTIAEAMKRNGIDEEIVNLITTQPELISSTLDRLKELKIDFSLSELMKSDAADLRERFQELSPVQKKGMYQFLDEKISYATGENRKALEELKRSLKRVD